MALIAHCLEENVTKAQPLLWPFESLKTVHSSMVPNGANINRTSCSLYRFVNIPTNNFRSEMDLEGLVLLLLLLRL